MTTLPSLFRAAALLPILLLPGVRASAAPPQVDPAALALLQKVQTAMQKTHSLSADCEMNMLMTDMSPNAHPDSPKIPFREISSFRVMKPNYLREQRWFLEKSKATGLWEKPKKPLIAASDGHQTWHQFGAGQYSADNADPQGHNLYAALPSDDFFDPAKSAFAKVQKQQAKGQLLSLTDAGTQNWQGQSLPHC